MEEFYMYALLVAGMGVWLIGMIVAELVCCLRERIEE